MTKRGRPPLAERLKRALEDVIAAERGERTLRARTLVLPDPPPSFDAERILRLRRRRNLTQAGLALLLNVSGKTVESWEQSRRKPSGAAARFLQLLEAPEALGQWLGGRSEGTHSSPDSSPEKESGSPAL
jgi:DNA-binding transcriptional regulator YiaG